MEFKIFTGSVGIFLFECLITENYVRQKGKEVIVWKKRFERVPGLVLISCFEKHGLLKIKTNIMSPRTNKFDCCHGTTVLWTCTTYEAALYFMIDYKSRLMVNKNGDLILSSGGKK